jgi:hypothetical protein
MNFDAKLSVNTGDAGGKFTAQGILGLSGLATQRRFAISPRGSCAA